MSSASSRLSRLNPWRRGKETKHSKNSKGKKDSNPQEGSIGSSIVLATSSESTAGPSIPTRDVSQSAHTSHVPANVDPQSREQVASSNAQSASSVGPPSTAVSAVAPPTAPPVPTASTTSPERLWDQAYDSLKDDQPKLVKAYEKFLSCKLDENASSSIASKSPESAIEQTDSEIRRSQMRQLVQAGLKKTEAEAKLKQDIGNVMQVILSAKDIVDSAIQTDATSRSCLDRCLFYITDAFKPCTRDKSQSRRDCLHHL